MSSAMWVTLTVSWLISAVLIVTAPRDKDTKK